MVRTVKDRITLLKEVLPKGGVCAEVGVCEGEFAKQILRHSEPRTLHLIDVWAGIGACGATETTDEVSRRRLVQVSWDFDPQIKSGEVMLHQGLSALVLESFKAGYFDWVYVDADHSYEGLLRDLWALHLSQCICDGGLIAGHDYGTAEDMPKMAHPCPGVAEAVDDFCGSCGWELVCRTEVGPREGEDPDGSNAPSFVLARR
ncbi:hypothetical protein LCGC14_0940020 [marine sediment metagenome]|uniref:Methyltransferase domain-containing protein n=1 Tax=marine sediment metagenome TaxID=412755 RepID=A0A0F9NQ21_9ZZZZ